MKIFDDKRDGKVLKWLGVIFLVIIVLGGLKGAVDAIIVSNGNKIINGEARSSFIDGSNETCVAGQSNNPQNANVSKETIVTYCSCVANKIADQLTNADVLIIKQKGSVSPEVQSKVEVASQECMQISQNNLDSSQ